MQYLVTAKDGREILGQGTALLTVSHGRGRGQGQDI